MRGFAEHFFHNKFNKSNNAEAYLLDSISNMTIKLP